ncbi:MAG: cytochrome c2 [Saprospiraceae bacterium]|jgi:cytochrome c2
MTHKLLKISLLLCSFFFFSLHTSAQEVDLADGKTSFKNYCASCHNKNMKDDMTGPALAGLEERWADYPREDLYDWIRNSSKMIADGHPRATELWAQWKPNAMTAFPNLTDAQIENVIAYINDAATKVPVNGGPDITGGVPVEKSDNTPLFIILAVILGLLAVVLARIVSNLNYMAQVKAGNAPAQRRTLVDILTSPGVIAFLLFAGVLVGGFTTVNNAIEMGRQQGYQPDQPIAFSHALHAGQQKIECQYCHDGARRSKHSVIPAANTCMNCHSAVKVGSNYGTKELTKIYASVGWNPVDGKYIENYVDKSREEIKDIYTTWIADNYIKENGTLDNEGEILVEEQWDGIVAALTHPESGDVKIAGAIEWKRVHNLPDHVYFNHSQHVSVGEVECQTCHGQIQEMEIVAQHSPLSMGWCINCHRQTAVKFADNPYYDSYELYHEQMKAGERDEVTVEDVGGIECQKCHY